MNIRVRLFASYREITGRQDMEVRVREGDTPKAVLESLAVEYPRLRSLMATTMFAVNGEYVDGNTALREGDEVAFIPPVSGGDGMYEVTDRELSLEQVAAKVRHPSMGAVVVFVGTVRDTSKGRKVLYLEYEAYKEMAERKLAEIGEDIRNRWGLERVAITHRVGHLELGEASVVIAVAAPHRAQAFEACRHAIERIKTTVPLWKKEVWEDGEVWVGLEG
jgi:molybdopterin synthase catalytic subunit